MLNEIDRRILRHWQSHGDISRRDLASSVGLSVNALNRRIEAMRKDGTILARRRVVDWSAFGFQVLVFLRVNLDKTQPNAWNEFLRVAREIDEIVVIETLVGRVDVRMDVRARDLEHYQEIYVDKILALPHIAEIESLLLISEISNKEALPI